ncbi:MAG: hypothetical protein HKN77_00210, partial [Woeseiaceae bacterium]|nr:hypothetical protein [Woeseiaceae bacterium]
MNNTTTKSSYRDHLWIVIVLFCVGVGWSASTVDPDVIAAKGHYGFLSIMPAVGA